MTGGLDVFRGIYIVQEQWSGQTAWGDERKKNKTRGLSPAGVRGGAGISMQPPVTYHHRRIGPIPLTVWEHWDLNPGRRVSSVLGWMSGSSLQFFRTASRTAYPFPVIPGRRDHFRWTYIVTGARKDATTPCSRDSAAGAWGSARSGCGIRPAAASGPASFGASSSCATSTAAFLASSTPLSFASSGFPLARGPAAARAVPGICRLWIASGHLKLFRPERARLDNGAGRTSPFNIGDSG